jgi:glycosyltransferase involved in cell wall biosynthesis
MVRGLAGAYKRFLLRRFQYVAVPGQEGMAYLEMLGLRRGGARPEAVILPNLVDETRFVPRAGHPRGELEAIRRSFEIDPADRVAICPARLRPVKGIAEYLATINPGMLRGWTVLIVGEGPLASALAAQIGNGGYAGRVRLCRYVPYEQMPVLYAMADLLLLPSLYDPNPLSVVEAMHSGLPLLLSDRVGNLPEALAEGENGWGFTPSLPETVRRASELAFSATNERLRAMGAASRSRADRFWNTRRAVWEFLDAVGAV